MRLLRLRNKSWVSPHCTCASFVKLRTKNNVINYKSKYFYHSPGKQRKIIKSNNFFKSRMMRKTFQWTKHITFPSICIILSLIFTRRSIYLSLKDSPLLIDPERNTTRVYFFCLNFICKLNKVIFSPHELALQGTGFWMENVCHESH